MTIATINFDAVIHSAIFLTFAGAGAMLAYQGCVNIWQAKHKLQAFAGFIVGVAGIFTFFFGLWNAFPSNPNAGVLPASTGDSSSVSTNSGGGSVRGL
jgi:hypothetical protein